MAVAQEIRSLMTSVKTAIERKTNRTKSSKMFENHLMDKKNGELGFGWMDETQSWRQRRKIIEWHIVGRRTCLTMKCLKKEQDSVQHSVHGPAWQNSATLNHLFTNKLHAFVRSIVRTLWRHPMHAAAAASRPTVVVDWSPVSIQTQSLAFLAVFVYATNATQAIACAWMETGLDGGALMLDCSCLVTTLVQDVGRASWMMWLYAHRRRQNKAELFVQLRVLVCSCTEYWLRSPLSRCYFMLPVDCTDIKSVSSRNSRAL